MVKKQGTSKYYGVAWDAKRNKWRSAVVYNGKAHKQKRFNSEIEAAKHYNNVIIELGIIRPLNSI